LTRQEAHKSKSNRHIARPPRGPIAGEAISPPRLDRKQPCKRIVCSPELARDLDGTPVCRGCIDPDQCLPLPHGGGSFTGCSNRLHSQRHATTKPGASDWNGARNTLGISGRLCRNPHEAARGGRRHLGDHWTGSPIDSCPGRDGGNRYLCARA